MINYFYTKMTETFDLIGSIIAIAIMGSFLAVLMGMWAITPIYGAYVLTEDMPTHPMEKQQKKERRFVYLILFQIVFYTTLYFVIPWK